MPELFHSRRMASDIFDGYVSGSGSTRRSQAAPSEPWRSGIVPRGRAASRFVAATIFPLPVVQRASLAQMRGADQASDYFIIAPWRQSRARLQRPRRAERCFLTKVARRDAPNRPTTRRLLRVPGGP